MLSIKDSYNMMDSGYSLLTVGENKVPNYKWASTKSNKVAPLTKEKFKKQYDYRGGFKFNDGTELAATTNIGYATGYNGLEVIDVDTKILDSEEEKEKFWSEFLELLESNIEDFGSKIVIYRTASGGYHLIYRCKKISGNLKLAKPKGYKEALVETRGVGGYCFIYTDKISELGYLDVKEISEKDRDVLIECSMYYNHVEDVEVTVPAKQNNDFQEQSVKTWDDFNSKNTVWSLISDQFTDAGKANGNSLVLRNGSKSKHSGYIFANTDKLFLYSTGTEYPHEHPLSAFDIYRIRNHNGDYKEACSHLYKEGYGSRLIVHEHKKDEFWSYTKKGAVVLDPFKFKQFLEGQNIYKYYPSTELDGYLFIQRDGNFIDVTSENKIKDLVLKHLYNISKIDVWNLMAARTNYFNKDFLSMIETSEIEISKDTKNTAIIYYKNTAVKIYKDKFDLIDYDSINGYVWKRQVIDRDIVLNEESDGVYKDFIWKISGESKDKYYTLKSVIGYLLHSFKNESKNRSIVFNDEMIADTPNGGSGKGLFHSAIAHLKKLSTIDGKSFDNSKSFLFQTVDLDSQVLLFDDVKKGFRFEDLFSVITEGITIEKKGKDAIKIPFADSPKISITTNYTIKGDGDSFYRRVFEVEMSSYFNKNHTPEDEYGHLLFSDWDALEWQKFDNFQLRCIQYYLNHGLVTSETNNLEIRKLINETNNDFIDFMDCQDFNGDRYYKSELKDLFVSEYSDFAQLRWFTSTLFNRWVALYCDYNKLTVEKGKTNGQRYMSITGRELKETETEEMPF